MHLLLTLLIGALGAWVLLKIKVPGGTIIGAILFVAACNIAFGFAEVPSGVKWIAQVIAGAFLGVGMDRTVLKTLKDLIAPSVLLVVSYLIVSLLLGFVLHAVSGIPLLTAFFAAVPGGLTEMAVIADDMGADAAVVSVFQITRVVAVICSFPFFTTRFLRAERKAPAPMEAPHADASSRMTKTQWRDFALTMAVAAGAGWLGKVSQFPGGALLFSVLGTGALKILCGVGFVPKTAKRIAQVFAGAYIGAKVTAAVGEKLLILWPYVLVMVVSYLAVSLFIGFLMAKLTRIDRVTAAFSSMPAGSSDMALIASDFATVTPTIAALQIIRMVSVITLYPTIISLAVRWFG